MADSIWIISAELFGKQSHIIRLQSEIIDELFCLVSMHVAAEDIDNMPAIEKISEAARLQKEMEL